MTQSPHSTEYEAYRPVVMGRNGMVSSGHPLASQAGIATLQKGGNAVDAAIATAAALNVVEPLMSGIGGDGFIMTYWKETGRIDICNGTGAAPYAATRERYLPEGIPTKGILSVSVPGLLDSWLAAHEKYGVLSLAQVLEPAMDLAANGFPISHVLSKAIASDGLLCRFPTSAAVFTRDGRPLRPGEILYQKDLAHTFQAVIDGGRDAFYQGEIAQAIVRFSDEQGGLLTMKDLADCHCRWQEAISTGYRGYTVYEAPPNSSGHVLLQELSLLNQFDVASLGCNTAESIHLMVEAKKLAFADREAYMADPEFIDVPIQGLLSDSYAKERAKLIDPERVLGDVPAGDPWSHQESRQRPTAAAAVGGGNGEEDTTCFVVVDRDGNAVCQLQSIQSAWGSSLIAGDTGILLNNRMTYWHLESDHVDCLQPGKRVRHTMNPVMVFRQASSSGNRQLELVCGTPGADTQVQTNMQVISHILDFGMTVAEAVEAPRWRNTHSPTESNFPHGCENELLVEGRFSAKTKAELERRGHVLNVLTAWGASGSEVMIQIDAESGAFHGAADPRRDGYAVGW
ncbi:MAG: gamma-glutamyltransferase [Chloroflexi bacterium]|nr:gamma-glutamyltransferase [Chloroflexota bacterium]